MINIVPYINNDIIQGIVLLILSGLAIIGIVIYYFAIWLSDLFDKYIVPYMAKSFLYRSYRCGWLGRIYSIIVLSVWIIGVVFVFIVPFIISMSKRR